jgi:thiol-disulfide isomerase/thioredoxin
MVPPTPQHYRACTMNARTASLLSLALSAAPLAQDHPPATTPPTTATSGRDLLRASLQFVQALPRCHLQATAKLVLPAAMAAELGESPSVAIELSYQLPNRIAVRTGEPFFQTEVCDGRQLLRLDEHFRLWSLAPVERTTIPFFTLGEPGALPGRATMARLQLRAGSQGALVDAQQVEVVGAAKVGDFDCHHLRVLDAGLQCELWIQQGAAPWVRRHRPTLVAPSPDAGNDEPAAPMLAYDVTFSVLEPTAAADAFAIAAPKDGERVADLDAAVEAKALAAMKAADAAKQPHASIGNPAPAVELSLLDGSTLRLADQRGKVVVLDFWATWCAPCVQGLPKVAALTSAKKDQGVVFVAVNQGEDRATIETFLHQKGLSLPVALGGAEVGAKFGVDGIPHVVVIGRDGVVAAVKIGFGGDSEVQLAAALEQAIAAGKPAK